MRLPCTQWIAPKPRARKASMCMSPPNLRSRARDGAMSPARTGRRPARPCRASTSASRRTCESASRRSRAARRQTASRPPTRSSLLLIVVGARYSDGDAVERVPHHTSSARSSIPARPIASSALPGPPIVYFFPTRIVEHAMRVLPGTSSPDTCVHAMRVVAPKKILCQKRPEGR